MKQKSLSLKALTIRASLWSFADIFISQIFRFGSNLILTRLLVPEMFGLMQLVGVFVYAITLLSDSGVRLNVIQHDRSEENHFLHTVWSFEVVKSFTVWVITLFLATPFAVFYGYTELASLIPLASLAIFFTGCTSTNFFLYQKHLNVRVISLIQIFATLIATIVMLTLAYIYRSVWALVSFALVRSSIITILSHFVPGTKMKFYFERKALIDILHFSKWIALSSTLTLFAMQFDKLFFGKTISISLLGLYGIAANLRQIIIFISNGFIRSIFIPLYKKALSYPPKEKNKIILKSRNALVILMLLPLFILTIWGKKICLFIYPETYSEVGNILKILAFGTSFFMISSTLTPILQASGNVKRNTAVVAIRLILLILGIVIGFTTYGFYGALYGLCLSQILLYPAVVYITYDYKIWTPLIDMCYFALCVAVGIVGGVIPGL